MPIYDFLCPACGNKFEQLVKLNETPQCPACSSPETERQFTFSVGISTGKTQGRALSHAKRVAKTRQSERVQAHTEYLNQHHDDFH